MKPKPSYYCTIADWIAMLKEYDPNLHVRVHTASRHDMGLLSGYVGDDKRFFEIDVGDTDE